ncbi:MAG: hypothetical protein J0L60_14850 [Ignavibacteria bacterium]|nr:hypothetical protein [Ignavibacteria bacterium]
MTTYIISAIFAALMILIASGISVAIKFESGSNPKDVKKRKIVFWIIAILTPVIFYLLGLFLLAPNAADDQMIFDNFMKTLPIATVCSLVVYLILGFILSKIFKTGKIGNWF